METDSRRAFLYSCAERQRALPAKFEVLVQGLLLRVRERPPPYALLHLALGAAPTLYGRRAAALLTALACLWSEYFRTALFPRPEQWAEVCVARGQEVGWAAFQWLMPRLDDWAGLGPSWLDREEAVLAYFLRAPLRPPDGAFCAQTWSGAEAFEAYGRRWVGAARRPALVRAYALGARYLGQVRGLEALDMGADADAGAGASRHYPPLLAALGIALATETPLVRSLGAARCALRVQRDLARIDGPNPHVAWIEWQVYYLQHATSPWMGALRAHCVRARGRALEPPAASELEAEFSLGAAGRAALCRSLSTRATADELAETSALWRVLVRYGAADELAAALRRARALLGREQQPLRTLWYTVLLSPQYWLFGSRAARGTLLAELLGVWAAEESVYRVRVPVARLRGFLGFVADERGGVAGRAALEALALRFAHMVAPEPGGSDASVDNEAWRETREVWTDVVARGLGAGARPLLEWVLEHAGWLLHLPDLRGALRRLPSPPPPAVADCLELLWRHFPHALTAARRLRVAPRRGLGVGAVLSRLGVSAPRAFEAAPTDACRGAECPICYERPAELFNRCTHGVCAPCLERWFSPKTAVLLPCHSCRTPWHWPTVCWAPAAQAAAPGALGKRARA